MDFAVNLQTVPILDRLHVVFLSSKGSQTNKEHLSFKKNMIWQVSINFIYNTLYLTLKDSDTVFRNSFKRTLHLRAFIKRESSTGHLGSYKQGYQGCVIKPALWSFNTSPVPELKICLCQTIYTAFTVRQHRYHCHMYCNFYKVTSRIFTVPALKSFP